MPKEKEYVHLKGSDLTKIFNDALETKYGKDYRISIERRTIDSYCTECGGEFDVSDTIQIVDYTDPKKPKHNIIINPYV